MTGPAAALVSVQLDPRWIELPVRSGADSGDWAAGAVDRALAARERTERPGVRQLYVQTYAALVDQLRERADRPGSQLGAAWALVADADLLPVTVVEAALHLIDGERGLDGFVDQLVVAPGERFAAPDVTELETPAGPAVRVQQLRLVGPREPEDEQAVQTSLVYVWQGPEADTALTLTAWFDSPVEAELSRGVLDELAGSLQQGA